MKRIVLLLPCLLFLSGCAQVFDGNLFSSVDSPPPLDKNALAKSSTNDIKKMAEDPSFYEQLKADPEALKAVQTALETNLSDPNATTQEKMEAATTYVNVTANATSVAEVKTTLVNNLGTIADAVSAGDYAKVLKLFLGNKTEPEIEATLTSMHQLAVMLGRMGVAAMKPDKTVNADIFFSGTTDPTGFATTALMATIAEALVTDGGGIAATATELAKDSPNLPAGPDMNKFKTAKAGQLAIDDAAGIGTTGFSYAYMSAVNSKLSL